MIFLEKSELRFSKCPTKNYIRHTPPPEKMSISLKRKTSITPPPPIFIIYPNQHASDVFLSFQFPLLKKTDNAQLCTGKIEAITSNNIENRP